MLYNYRASYILETIQIFIYSSYQEVFFENKNLKVAVRNNAIFDLRQLMQSSAQPDGDFK